VGPEGGGHGSAAEGGPFGITARIRVGRFVFEVGSPAGTRADPSPDPALDPAELQVALGQPEAPTLAEAEAAIGEAESVTGRVERALELFTAVAKGQILDPEFLRKESDTILAALDRADREGRHRDSIRLARALSRLLALTGRWTALVETLRIALRASTALGDAPGIAWARHELGTLALGAEDAQAANGQLREALEIRRDVGDAAGAQVTEHNLATLRGAFPSGMRPLTVALIVAAILLVVAGGLALAVWAMGDDPPAADTTAPVVEITEGPDDETEETSASFEFEANEPVERYECRLDDGDFEECVSPYNTPGQLEPGEHVFVVRVTDPAGNRSDPAEDDWTITPAEGPRIAIVRGPKELTNEPRAEFILDSGEAVALECRLDDGNFEPCSIVHELDADEGEHVFTAHGLDARGTAGPPARYRWTVDTTPPTVEFGALEVGETTAEIEFSVSEDATTVCTLTKDEDGSTEDEGECPSPVSYEGLSDNSAYTLEVVATDLAGNVGEPAEQTFQTDPDVD
jgi:tetratricopeptide (TPR) repeat protein